MTLPKHDSINQLINHILQCAPASDERLQENPFGNHSWSYENTLEALRFIRGQGLLSDLHVYDIKGTHNLWIKRNGELNTPVVLEATKQLLATRKARIEAQHGKAEWHHVLPTVSRKDFTELPINRFGTTLNGLFAKVFHGSPYAGVRFVIEQDPEFAQYSDLQPYDMVARKWKLPDGTPNYEMARTLTGLFFRKLAQATPRMAWNERISSINRDDSMNLPLNRYGTTLHQAVTGVYKGSLYNTVKDYLDQDGAFAQYRDLEVFDLPVSRKWTLKDGSPDYALARKAVGMLVGKLARKHPEKSFSELVTTTSVEEFCTTPINQYGTTLRGMMFMVYGTTGAAFSDYLENSSSSLLKPAA